MNNLDLAPQTFASALLESLPKSKVYYNLPPAQLVEISLARNEGKLTSTGALMVDTGALTGRSPKDRYIVLDEITKNEVWWGESNIPFDAAKFNLLFQKMTAFLSDKEVFVRDAVAGANTNHQLPLKAITTKAWHNLFCYNMFLRPAADQVKEAESFTILCVPEFEADPKVDGTSSPNFSIINFTERIILIGGTGYAGEIKKGIFSVLNFLLPLEKNILSMHCAANVGNKGDTAIFFGLSGTGKTTLSTDPSRWLIGDDEHGWSEEGVFNFEGGCYAKVIDLKKEKEPEIWEAIKFGAIVENTRFKPDSREVDFTNKSVTENTRTAYPIHFIQNAVETSIGGNPKNIFFLTADAFGVIPPISKLNKSQAMYHFLSGYTAKVAGTEIGIIEPKLTFSTCFGAAFLPLHPTKYAALLGEKMEKFNTNVWLINTGWTGGPYGVGKRMKLEYTRAMISAALEEKLDYVEFEKHPIFGIAVPQECPNVPSEILNHEATWKDQEEYDRRALKLAVSFKLNFKRFSDCSEASISEGAPL
jgi:phosphoenolpyruvate carboxykinase (ATP)